MVNKLEKYIGAEMELITLMGYANPVLGKQTQKIHAKTNDPKPVMKELPQWARDDGASLRLIAEHNLAVVCGDEVAIADYDKTLPAGSGAMSTDVSEHPDKETALRFAVIRAVILKYQRAKGVLMV